MEVLLCNYLHKQKEYYQLFNGSFCKQKCPVCGTIHKEWVLMFSPKLFFVYMWSLKAIEVIFFSVFENFYGLSHRYVYFGLSAVLRGPSYLIAILFFILVKKHFQNKNSRPIENGGREDAPMNKEDNCKSKERLPGSCDTENESCI